LEPPPAPASLRTAGGEHTIGKGETLDAISKRYGVTVQQLRDANPGLDPRRLLPGRTVRLPAGSEGQPAATDLPSESAADGPVAAQHTIRSGDTLDGIARRYGTTVQALQAANPGLNPRRLLPGRTIRVPN
jgi:LysM repeat protein